jgi:hypothetical protein
LCVLGIFMACPSPLLLWSGKFCDSREMRYLRLKVVDRQCENAERVPSIGIKGRMLRQDLRIRRLVDRNAVNDFSRHRPVVGVVGELNPDAIAEDTVCAHLVLNNCALG